MNTVLVVCMIVLTVSFVIAVVYLVQTLCSIRKAADELEILLKNVNHEIEVVSNITGRIQNLVKKITSPWVHAGGWLGGLVSSFVKNKREEQQQL